MANIQEFKNSPTNPTSLLFDNYLSSVPGLMPVVNPDFLFVIGATGDATLANGVLSVRDGADATPGTRYGKFSWDRIRQGTFKASNSTVATAKVVDVDITDIDFLNTNPTGLTGVYLDYHDGRLLEPYKQMYVINSAPSAGETNAQRAAKIVRMVNADPNSRVTAQAIASGTGANAPLSRIRLTSKYKGEDIKVSGGQGTGTVTVVTQAASDFGTSQYLSDNKIPVSDKAFYAGRTYKVVYFTYDSHVTAANFGDFKGGSVGNNAQVIQHTLVALYFEVGAADAKLATFDTAQQGKQVPVSDYLAKGAALSFV